MQLKQVNIKPFYNSKHDNILMDFYIPVLSEAKSYKRVSAYFDSNILSYYSKGIEQIVAKNGHIQFIFSHQLNEKDFNEIKNGYTDRQKFTQRLGDSIKIESPTNEIRNLGYLIKHGYVDIKIAFTKPSGIFHDKFGIVENDNDKIYFRGSNNETVASIISNFESFETSCSWNSDKNEQEKINNAELLFNKLWNDAYCNDVIVIDFPTVLKDKLISFSGDKLILTHLKSDNCFIMDYDEQLICINKLKNPIIVSPKSNFFKRELEAYILSVENDDYIFDSSLSYMTIQKLISTLTSHANKLVFDIYITPSLRNFLYNKDIQIEKRRGLGLAIKAKHQLLHNDIQNFSDILEKEMDRKLRTPQLWDAYHFAKMQRGANFSVPGSGKTSIVYGAYAYLASPLINEIDKIVMVGPINSFSSWEIEFKKCFGNKKILNAFNFQKEKTGKSTENYDQIVHNKSNSNLFLFNYESLNSNLDALKKIVDNRTLLVFDEVHRIKSIVGKRASDAKEICKQAKYRVVLTGTPIPNGYVDIFNMFNILFSDEYNDFFAFDEAYLKAAQDDEDKRITINNRIFPFFCRINKDDLAVPKPEPDDIVSGYCFTTEKEDELFRIIFRNFSNNILLLYIRLMQASTNPCLLLNKIDDDVLSSFESIDYLSAGFGKQKVILDQQDKEFIKNFGMTSKFYRGIEIIKEKAENGPIIVWGIFIDTIQKIKEELKKNGVHASVITGGVSFEEREKIISDFKNGLISVLITNPHTLGESVSLHEVCHQAIYFEYSFNLVHLLQSKDRIHRLGLKDNQKTEYTFLVLDSPDNLLSPIDLKIYNRLKEKEMLQTKALCSENIEILIDNLDDDINAVLGRF